MRSGYTVLRETVSEDWAGDEEATSVTSRGWTSHNTLDGTETAMVELVDNAKSLEPTCTLVDA